MSINKRRDWSKGKWCFCIKVFTPDGAVMESDILNVHEVPGRKLWKAIRVAIGLATGFRVRSGERTKA